MRRYHGWHEHLIHLLQGPSIDESDLRKHFDIYFDELRDPLSPPPANGSEGDNLPGITLICLRLALIRWIYIERKPIAGNWRHIIGQIGY